MRARGFVELLLIVLLALGVLLHFGMRPDNSRRNVEFAPNMAESPGYGAQDANPNFADGKTLRTPPPGTVARGFLPLSNQGRLLDRVTAWEKMPAEAQALWDAYGPPWTFEDLDKDAQADILTRGRAVFLNVCATCHGPAGIGGAEAVKRGVPLPPSLLDEKIRAYTPGHFFHVVTMGKGNMKPHRNHVTRSDRWRVIRYLRTLQGASK